MDPKTQTVPRFKSPVKMGPVYIKLFCMLYQFSSFLINIPLTNAFYSFGHMVGLPEKWLKINLSQGLIHLPNPHS